MASEGASIEHGYLVRQWKWPLRMLFWWLMIGGCVWGYAVSAHWYWAWRDAPNAVVEQASANLERDLAALHGLGSPAYDAIAVADRISQTLHEKVLIATRGLARALMDWPARFRASRDGRPMPPDAGGAFVDGVASRSDEIWTMLSLGTRMLAVRTATYLAVMPLFGLALMVGIVDGLVARARRKACAGRESGSLYHRAKLGLSGLLITGYIAAVGVPALVEPACLLAALAIIAALLVRTQCAYYKKYL